MRRKIAAASISLTLLAVMTIAFGAAKLHTTWMGKQPDGSFLVSSGQRIEGDGLAFNGGPSGGAAREAGLRAGFQGTIGLINHI